MSDPKNLKLDGIKGQGPEHDKYKELNDKGPYDSLVRVLFPKEWRWWNWLAFMLGIAFIAFVIFVLPVLFDKCQQ